MVARETIADEMLQRSSCCRINTFLLRDALEFAYGFFMFICFAFSVALVVCGDCLVWAIVSDPGS
jgi:hypothetical protein